MNFEQYAPDANKFVREVATELGNAEDTEQAYRVMKAVLHTVRDILSPEESMHLVAQLPLIMKGVYVEGWHITQKDRIRSMQEFLARLREKDERSSGRDFGNDETATHHIKCVLNVLKRHVATGQIQDMIDQFPMELAGLWITAESDTAVHH